MLTILASLPISQPILVALGVTLSVYLIDTSKQAIA